MIGIVHMDERPDVDPQRSPHLENLVGLEHGERFVGEVRCSPLELFDLVVADDGPERSIAARLDPVDRAARVERHRLAPPGF